MGSNRHCSLDGITCLVCNLLQVQKNGTTSAHGTLDIGLPVPDAIYGYPQKSLTARVLDTPHAFFLTLKVISKN